MLEGKRVVIIGSEGFIGRRLVVKMVELGASVIGIDKASGFDINDKARLKDAMAGADYVFHMAVLPFNPCAQDMRLCIETNVMGTLNVVEAAIEAKVRKMVYSSASAVYGNIDDVKSVNEAHPCNPDSMYGRSKLMGEMIVRNNGLPYIILRYMNVYGPGQVNGLIPAILKCVDTNAKPTIYGDGYQSYDFVHVDDVIAANILAAGSDLKEGIFNIGGENEIYVIDVFRSILKETKSDLIPVYKAGASARRVGNSALAKKMLGYQPTKEFNKSIKELVNGYTYNKTVHGR